MNKINIGLIGYGTVGAGVAKILHNKKGFIRQKYNIDFNIKTLCDRSIHKKVTKGLGLEKTKFTKNYEEILNDPEIQIVVELIGGLHPAQEIILGALKSGKHVVTANKKLIADKGKEIFLTAQENNRNVYFESAVGAGIPIIKMLQEGVAGNQCNKIYAIINGTCNFILTEMTKNKLTFNQALDEAQKRGYAEKNPTLDINGMDSAHKLAILTFLAFGKSVTIDDMYVEGITQISHADIQYVTELNLALKLLAIAKKVDNQLEVRVHPTLITKDHTLAHVHGVKNAIFMDLDPLGDLLVSGEGAGQMSAASGVVSDLIHFGSQNATQSTQMMVNMFKSKSEIKLRNIDNILTKFYIRFMATDKPGVLSKITGILGQYNIGINSVSQKMHNRAFTVPVVILTDYAPEKMVRLALDEIYKLSVVKSQPVAIRMEKLS